MGDDLQDIPVMKRCGLAVAPANAVEEVRAVAHYVTRAHGGRGAVREFCDLVRKARGAAK
jgi:3-deoxy-D-manno-octulosonate 8-phosphate phosphatase (KDO 8-P phosphatase)